MRSLRCLACLPALLLPILLSGCSYLFPTKRHLPVPIAPAAVQTVSPDDLVKQLNQHWDAMNTLTATVEIYATQTKTKEGVATDFPSCRGYILMRKPKMLRVLGKYFGVTIFDMVSDGSHFTLLIPHDNLAIEGANSISEKSTNPLLNLRPDFFLDAIAVRGLDSDNEYMVAGDTETIEDAAQKRLYIEPEYTLSVMRPKAGPEKLPLRVITFHREDMLPYDQDVYDKDGNLETQIIYSTYTNFSAGRYPSKIIIKRPHEGIQLVLSVERVEQNVDMPDNQFQLKIPEGTKIQTLK
jgi:hypothetical protein